MNQITWEDLRPKREAMGLSLPKMARKCGIEEWQFLEMIEYGEIRTTSSAIMACVAKGYEFERGQCVGMIAHWTPTWPRSRFEKTKKTKDEARKKTTYTPKKKRVQYWPGAITEIMDERRISFEYVRKVTKNTMQMNVLRDVVSGMRDSITLTQLDALCDALWCKRWDLSPEFKPEEQQKGEV